MTAKEKPEERAVPPIHRNRARNRCGWE